MMSSFAAAIVGFRSEIHSPVYGLSEKPAGASEKPTGPR